MTTLTTNLLAAACIIGLVLFVTGLVFGLALCRAAAIGDEGMREK